MTPRSSAGGPRAPLVATDLDPFRGELEDDLELAGVLIAGEDFEQVSAAHASVAGSRMQAVRLTAAELEHVQFSDVVLVDCDLSAVRAERAVLRRVVFERCRLPGAVFSEASLEDVVFVGCAMSGASLHRAKGTRVAFDDCLLDEADLSQATLPDTRFDDSVLRRALIGQANLKGSTFHRADLSGLRGVASLSGCVLDPAHIIPVGERFIAEAGIVIGAVD